jgi:CPA1 family monovalent cation:H+ antiporter
MHFPLSPIIATTVAALLMGNYGRSKIHPRAEEFVEKLWGEFAFIANSLIFILIGLLVATMPPLSASMLLVVLITIVVVALARAISIYPVVTLFNLVVPAHERIPRSWQHLLSWGSLRGALAVTMVLLIPNDLTFPGWTLTMSPKEFLLALTVGCIVATLFIKAPTIQFMMRRLKLDTLTEIEQVEALEARALIHHEVTDRISRYAERGYIDTAVAQELLKEHATAFAEICQTLRTDSTKPLAERVLRMFAIGIERRHLKELYHHGEVDEAVFRHLGGKLQLQLEAIEVGNLDPDMSLHTDGKDIFDRLANFIESVISPRTREQDVDHLFMYYRAQAIISRKVVKELSEVDAESAAHIFTKEALTRVIALYTTFKEQSESKMAEIATGHKVRYEALARTLALRGVSKIEETMLTELFERQLITPKLYVTLKEELNIS